MWYSWMSACPGNRAWMSLKTVRDRGFTTPIILVTTFDDDETFFGAIQAGANGFLRKDSSLAELTSCIDRVISGERVFRPSVTRTARSGLEALQPKFESLDLPEPLTKKEAEVLSLMTARIEQQRDLRRAWELRKRPSKHTRPRYFRSSVCGSRACSVEGLGNWLCLKLPNAWEWWLKPRRLSSFEGRRSVAAVVSQIFATGADRQARPDSRSALDTRLLLIDGSQGRYPIAPATCLELHEDCIELVIVNALIDYRQLLFYR